MARAPRSASAARHRARELLLQALYQWQMTDTDPGEIIVQFVEDRDMAGADVDYFRELMRAITVDADAIDAEIAPLLQRSIGLIDPVERAILRIAGHELRDRLEVPARVVIDEAIELARRYGASEGHRFINGVIDRLAHRLRVHEFET